MLSYSKQSSSQTRHNSYHDSSHRFALTYLPNILFIFISLYSSFNPDSHHSGTNRTSNPSADHPNRFPHQMFQDGWNCDFEGWSSEEGHGCRWDNSPGGKVLWEPTLGGDNPQVIFYSQEIFVDCTNTPTLPAWGPWP